MRPPDCRSDGRTARTALPRTLVAAVCALLLVSSAFAGSGLAARNLHDGSVDPGTVDESSKVKHTITYHVENVSNDGNTDELFVEFPNSVNASDLSSFSADVQNAETGASVSISSSPTIVDGPDGDGVRETVRVGVQPSGQQESIDLVVEFTGYATWPAADSDTVFPIDAAVIDSKYAAAGPTQVASVTVRNTDGSTDETTTESADFDVAIDSTTAPVTEGETVSATATVTNDGSASGQQTVTLSVGGSTVDSTTVSLDAGASTDVSLSWATEAGDAGDRTLTVASANDSASTTVSVENANTDDDSTDDDSTPTEDTPTDDTPTDGTPTDDTPTDDTPTDDTPTDDTPTEDTPADDDTPAEDDSPTDTATPAPGTTEPTESGQNGPGFGVVAALIAVGTLLVAARLRDS